MAAVTVAFSANAGIALTLPGLRIWIDALHRQAEEAFSPVSRDIWAYMKSCQDFSDPDILAFTHCHGDHYDKEYVLEALSLYPKARLILPEQAFSRQLLLEGEETICTEKGYRLRFVRTVHGGAGGESVPHYSLFIEGRGLRLFYGGDVTGPSPRLEALLAGYRPDIAFLPFPWCTLIRGRLCLEKVIQPRHLILLHLPFAEDDVYGYREAVQRALPKLPFIPDVRALMNPYQTERVETE